MFPHLALPPYPLSAGNPGSNLFSHCIRDQITEIDVAPGLF
jgi:hypothetical protein